MQGALEEGVRGRLVAQGPHLEAARAAGERVPREAVHGRGEDMGPVAQHPQLLHLARHGQALGLARLGSWPQPYILEDLEVPGSGEGGRRYSACLGLLCPVTASYRAPKQFCSFLDLGEHLSLALSLLWTPCQILATFLQVFLLCHNHMLLFCLQCFCLIEQTHIHPLGP